MILPKGQAVYANLSTSFTHLDALLAELESNRFTGYVQVNAWEYEGILLLVVGDLTHAIEETKSASRHGPAAAEAIAARAQDKDATISVYRLPEELAELLAGLFRGEPVYKDLASDFTSLDKLIAKLEDEKHTGYVEIRLPKAEGPASVFMRDGQTIESIISSDDTTLTGSDALAQILKTAANGHALFTVYRVDLAKAYDGDDSLADHFGRAKVLSLWREVLRAAERAVDGQVKPGTFQMALKREFVDHAAAYPFLDPFAAEFEYRSGQIRFDGKAAVDQFNQGLAECLTQALSKLLTEQRALMGPLNSAMVELRNKHGALLETTGLVAAFPELFDT